MRRDKFNKKMKKFFQGVAVMTMKKVCKHCGKEFFTEYPTKLYCSLNCANAAYYEREESDYKYLPETTEPIFTFECAECGKEVKIYSKYDQRHTYCCGKCAKKAKNRRESERAKKRRGGNVGMSGGMSLGSLIRRERRDLI